MSAGYFPLKLARVSAPAHSHGDILHRISEALALGKMVLLPTRSVPLVKEFAMTTLRTRMMEDMQVRNLSRHTQDAYLLQVSQFARHFAKSPALLGPEDIRAYQVYLTNEKKLAPRSVHVTVAALRFLYRVTLGLDWDFDQIIPCPKAPKTLAVILSPEEVLHFLGCIKSFKHHAILTTCYAAGLRISEATRLKPEGIDRQRMVLRVEQGKGQKDRYVMQRGPKPPPSASAADDVRWIRGRKFVPTK